MPPILKSVNILNFRSIKEAWIHFTPRCRVLVGVNEAGKSNILKALALIDPKRTPSPEDVRDFLPDEQPNQEALVEFIFTIQPDEIANAVKKIAESTIFPEGIFIRSNGQKTSLLDYLRQRNELIYTVDLGTGKRTVTDWTIDEADELLTPVLEKTNNAPNAANVTLLDGAIRSFQGLKFVNKAAASVLEEKHFKAAQVENFAEALLAELKPTFENSLPQCIFWEYAEKNILPAQVDLNAFRGNPDHCIPLRRMFELAGYKDISTAITTAQAKQQGMRNLLNKVAAAATSHLHTVWAEAKGVKVDLSLNGTSIEPTFRDSHNVFGMARRSDGFKRFVTFLLHVSASAKTSKMVNTIYLHDEPDAGLHPRGADYLMQELIKISETNYVLYSTHSIFMVDRKHIGRHLIVTKKGEISTAEEADESNFRDEEVLFNALGTSIFENLKTKNLVFEGWRDKRLFELFVAKSKSVADIREILSSFGTCHVRGVKDVPNIVPLLELGGRDYAVVSDADAPGKEGKKAHSGKGPWFTYDDLSPTFAAVTAEDFLSVAATISAVNHVAKECGMTERITETDFNPGLPKLKSIDGWFARNGQTGEQKKRSVDAVKTCLFEDLKISTIASEYENVVRNLLAHFSR